MVCDAPAQKNLISSIMYVKAILCKWTAALEADTVIWKILHYRIAYIAQKPRSRYDKMFCGLKRQKYADVQQHKRQQKENLYCLECLIDFSGLYARLVLGCIICTSRMQRPAKNVHDVILDVIFSFIWLQAIYFPEFDTTVLWGMQ